MHDTQVLTIFDRPAGLRVIGLTQVAFGTVGLVGSVGLLVATLMGVPALSENGYLYSALVFVGIAVPCLVIGNYVDDLRRGAVIAQMGYSAIAATLAGYLLIVRGPDYEWTVPVFGITVQVAVGRVALMIVVVQVLIALYLIARWERVVPPDTAVVVRDRTRARLVERGIVQLPVGEHLLAPDGTSIHDPDEVQHVLEARRVVSEEGTAILCPNCGGATSLSKVNEDNTLTCDYCGVRVAVGSVFVPCTNHPEYLAAATCAVCGQHFCRRCLTAQEPPVDERWRGSLVLLCRDCFEGRYIPAVATTAFALPIEELFGEAGSRFRAVAHLYRKFLSAYAKVVRFTVRLSVEVLPRLIARGSRERSDNCVAFLFAVIIAIIAVPIIVGVLLLLGAVIVVPLLFYAGLIGVVVQAVRILRGTDFVSLDEARERGLLKRKRTEIPKESELRRDSRHWERGRTEPRGSYKAPLFDTSYDRGEPTRRW